MRARLRSLLGGRRSLRLRVAVLAIAGVALLAAQLAAQLVAVTDAQVRGLQAARLEQVLNDVSTLDAVLQAQHSNLLLARATGQEMYATAFDGGRASESRAVGQLHRDAVGPSQAAGVGALSAAVGAWEAWAQDQVSRSGPQNGAELVEGESQYQTVRSALGALTDGARADFVAAVNGAAAAGVVAFVTSVLGSLAVAGVLLVLALRIVRLGVEPVIRLAGTARSIARGEPASIEAVGSDEVRELALALEAWQQSAAERAVVAEQAPIGILRVDATGRIVTVNRAFELMYRGPAERLRGLLVTELVHVADRPRIEELLGELRSGRRTSVTLEARGLRANGSVVWCSVTAGLLLSAEGRPAGTVGVVEDISERKAQAERAARIQRELWPARPPALAGYDVAGACLPAQEVAGDLYDWALGEDGQLDLTVADVMGKGIGAAMVAAMLRTALRAAPAGLGPAARLTVAAKSMTLGRNDDATFVTVFHARLDPGTGVLRYVDAGHGYCHLLRADGEVRPLPVRSLPLGVPSELGFEEGTERLEAGETLVVYSDGLVEQPGLPSGRSVLAEIPGAADAADAVHRLLEPMPAHLEDDVTVLAVRKLANHPSAAVA